LSNQKWMMNALAMAAPRRRVMETWVVSPSRTSAGAEPVMETGSSTTASTV
jgi:hypothetical protein